MSNNGTYVKRKVYSSMNPPPSCPLVDDEPSLTKQSFAADADINNILARYARTGYMTDPLNPSTRKPQYGDFSSVPDFQEAQEIVNDAYEMFEALPGQLRARFNHDPAGLLAFLAEPSNYEEAVKLGIIEPKIEPKIDQKPPVSEEVS
ncbi:internal scaffolding protein VP3 [Gokushovirinae Bog1183_53]|uniref:internal scaffolding protein VP3 n=1 Tax=Gokushovirinae Bog1183_53 TaxID=1655646 RepID=UPI00063D5645|nr:internal scaffolding protein VP3 [Gokushovirinae Bog1183_53]AKI26870.1 internal scaffolding protein VP3 [Gokushovirinae Bog1183_53]